MIYKLPIHSFVDVITNSSTEIYITVREKALDFTKELFNKILKFANVNGTFDDYFTAEVLSNTYDLQNILSDCIKTPSDKIFSILDSSEISIIENNEKYWRAASELVDYWDDLIPKHIEEYLLSTLSNYDNEHIKKYLIIRSKNETNDEIIHLSEEFEKIFEAYESYEG